jgi:hypothetical protein
MARLTPDVYKPQLSFRFRISFSQLPDVQFYGRAVELPKVDNSPLVLDYGNVQMKVKNKTKWNDITITCYAYEKMTIDQLWQYLTDLHQDVPLGRDEYGDTYKKDVQIQLLAPSGETVVGTWKLVGAFMSSIDFGSMDWSDEAIVQPSIVLAYDYATFERVT